jgi:hypothetical protein
MGSADGKRNEDSCRHRGNPRRNHGRHPVGQGFRETAGTLTGPYPSGAPAIFIDQVAQTGPALRDRVLGGRRRFRTDQPDAAASDGVDVSALAIDPTRPTGSAFVRYRADGTRLHLQHRAQRLRPDRHDARGRTPFGSAPNHLHVMGSSLSSRIWLVDEPGGPPGRSRTAGGTVSFDPNLRKEMLSMRRGCARRWPEILGLTDLFLPSRATN